MVAPRCDWLAAAKIKNIKRATLIITFVEVEEQEAKKKKKKIVIPVWSNYQVIE